MLKNWTVAAQMLHLPEELLALVVNSIQQSFSEADARRDISNLRLVNSRLAYSTSLCEGLFRSIYLIPDLDRWGRCAFFLPEHILQHVKAVIFTPQPSPERIYVGRIDPFLESEQASTAWNDTLRSLSSEPRSFGFWRSAHCFVTRQDDTWSKSLFEQTLEALADTDIGPSQLAFDLGTFNFPLDGLLELDLTCLQALDFSNPSCIHMHALEFMLQCCASTLVSFSIDLDSKTQECWRRIRPPPLSALQKLKMKGPGLDTNFGTSWILSCSFLREITLEFDDLFTGSPMIAAETYRAITSHPANPEIRIDRALLKELVRIGHY